MFEAIQQEGVSIDKIEGESLNSFLDNAEKAKDEEEEKEETENTEKETKKEDKEEEKKVEKKEDEEEEDENKSKDDKKDDKKSDKSKDKSNLNNNPRFQKIYKQNKDYERTINSLVEKVENLTKKLDSTLNKDNEEIPDWFKEDWGDDKEKWNEYQKRFGVNSTDKKTNKEEEEKEAFERAKKRIISDLEDIEFENDIDLSETKEGLKLRQEILKFAQDEQIVDKNGQYDIKKAYKFYTRMNVKSDGKKSDNTDKKKQIADKSLNSSKGGDDKKSKSFKVGSFRNVSWEDLN